MKLSSAFWWAILFGILHDVNLSPVIKGKFLFSSFPKGIDSRVTTDQDQPTTTYSVKFVPLITILAGLFPNFMSKFGQFTGVNKIVNTRRFDIADKHTNITEPTEEYTEEVELEEEKQENKLIECDGSHLGLWPDKSNIQRYYKCEVDPRTPANCIKDYFQEKHLSKKDETQLERLDIPSVKPCFLLTMLKCSNGFKYSHKTRICVPDIVFGSL